MNVTQCKFNHALNTVELTMDNGEVVSISQDSFIAMIKTLPEFDEEFQIRELLKKLWEIREKRLLTYDKLDKEVDDLRAQHKTIRGDLATAKDRLRVLALMGMTKDLAAEKVTLGERRMLIKLLGIEEANLKGQLAKILVGKGNQ